IDAYIAGFPTGTQLLLHQLRRAIRGSAPDSDETISYAIAAFKLHGRILIYFAGYAHHIGVYPLPKGDVALLKAIAPYKAGKGTLRFPLDKELPLGLIARIVKQRARENALLAKASKR
ncbi:MAG TPA: DUF1801 domain-containing protein, partial [Flavobacteriales bacterium]|nr:DUF1801 domain-containing protein [Flavobacteriales bacterium]